MKKILITVLVVVVIVPNIALAAWWNPFTWKIFNRTQEVMPTTQETVVPEKKEPPSLDKKIETLNEVRTTSSQSSKISTNFSSPITSSYEDSSKNIEICNGVSYDTSTCTSQAPFYCPLTGQGYCKNAVYESLMNTLDTLEQQRKTKLEADTDRRNSTACVNAKKAYDNIMIKINRKSESITDHVLSSESSKNSSELADLSIQSVPLRNEYYSACENFVPDSPKIYNTTCSSSFGSISCSTQ